MGFGGPQGVLESWEEFGGHGSILEFPKGGFGIPRGGFAGPREDWGLPGALGEFWGAPSYRGGFWGAGGENVKAINQQTGAFVEISRQLPPNGDPNFKLFVIRGTPQQIDHAKQLIEEKIEVGAP